MPLNENDLSYIIDIVDCIMDINEFTKSISYYESEKDKMRKLAVEIQLEIIGQAANEPPRRRAAGYLVSVALSQRFVLQGSL